MLRFSRTQTGGVGRVAWSVEGATGDTVVGESIFNKKVSNENLRGKVTIGYFRMPSIYRLRRYASAVGVLDMLNPEA